MTAQSRPKQLRKGARREAILAVAARAFLKRGYAGISLSAIAAEVGGSKTTLWRHFRSKAELFEAVLERETSSFRERLEMVLHDRRTFRLLLGDFCLAYMDMLTSKDSVALHRLVIGEASRFPELGQIFFERGPLLVNTLLAEAIAAAIDRGELSACDSMVAARHITAMCLSGRFQHILYQINDDERAAKGDGSDGGARVSSHEAQGIVDFFMKAFGTGRD